MTRPCLWAPNLQCRPRTFHGLEFYDFVPGHGRIGSQDSGCVIAHTFGQLRLPPENWAGKASWVTTRAVTHERLTSVHLLLYILTNTMRGITLAVPASDHLFYLSGRACSGGPEYRKETCVRVTFWESAGFFVTLRGVGLYYMTVYSLLKFDCFSVDIKVGQHLATFARDVLFFFFVEECK